MEPIRVEPGEVDRALAREIASVLRGGGIVAMRTDTTYGLLASVSRSEALARLAALKARPADKPFLVLAPDWAGVEAVASRVTPAARRLGSRYWPGPLTLVLPARSDLPREVSGEGPTVAVRVPQDPLLSAVLGEVGAALAAPSANRPGEPPATTAREIVETFGDAVDRVLDGGATEGARVSTIVDCTGPRARVVRAGPVVPTERELGPR